MEITSVTMLEINEQSQINDARRQLVSFACTAGFDEKNQNRIALLCTELGTNLIKHTPHGGHLLAQTFIEEDDFGIEIYSLDSGNGMNTEQCLVDGFSSIGTLGIGLGAVKRLSDEYSAHSQERIGSVVQTRIWNNARSKKPDLSVGGVNVPKKGELLSGDKSLVVRNGKQIYCVVVDGLGHGIEASEAASLAMKRCKENLSSSPAEIIRIMHKSLRGSRGAVGAVAKLDLNTQEITYCGLGNIEGVMYTNDESKHLVSLNGTLGYEASKVKEFTSPFAPGSMLIMHSDGLSSKTFSAVHEVANESAPLIAGWLYNQHSRTNDDATVLVLKHLRRA